MTQDELTEKQAPQKRICKICGCTDENCKQCIEKTGMPCYWIEKDLCSACRTEEFAKLRGEMSWKYKRSCLNCGRHITHKAYRNTGLCHSCNGKRHGKSLGKSNIREMKRK